MKTVKTTETKIPVVIRMEYNEDYKSRDPLALFPTLLGTNNANTMTCYSHVGQHGVAYVDFIRKCKKPMEHQMDSVNELKKEIISIYGDVVIFCDNIPKNSRQLRIAAIDKI